MFQPIALRSFHPAESGHGMSDPQKLVLDEVIVRLEDALADIDALGAGLAGNHISHAIELLKGYRPR